MPVDASIILQECSAHVDSTPTPTSTGTTLGRANDHRAGFRPAVPDTASATSKATTSVHIADGKVVPQTPGKDGTERQNSSSLRSMRTIISTARQPLCISRLLPGNEGAASPSASCQQSSGASGFQADESPLNSTATLKASSSSPSVAEIVSAPSPAATDIAATVSCAINPACLVQYAVRVADSETAEASKIAAISMGKYAGENDSRPLLRELGTVGAEAIHGASNVASAREHEKTEVPEARLARIRCYLREDDPDFIRKNLKCLQAGTLTQLAVGDTVTVARRYREGDRSEGGAGSVIDVRPGYFYDIKYVIGGTEKKIDGCFVEKTELLRGSRKRRGSTPRCPDCHSFLHECTCEGFLDAGATAAVEKPVRTPAQSNITLEASLSSRPSRSFKRPRSAIGKGVRSPASAPCPGDAERAKPPATVLHRVAESTAQMTSSQDNQRVAEEGDVLVQGDRDPLADKLVCERLELLAHGECADVVEGARSIDVVGERRNAKESPDDAERDEGQKPANTSVTDTVTRAIHEANDGQISEPQSASPATRDPVEDDARRGFAAGSAEHDGGSGEEERGEGLESLGSGDAEALWTERQEATPDALNGNDGSGSADPGGTGLEGTSAGRENAESADRDPPQWRARKGDLVEVARRTSPGVNKLGGTARVVRVDASTGAIDVRYVVEGGWERGIDPRYVRPAVLGIEEKRPTLGRCQHCGSLRVDCGQRCEFYTQRSSRPALLRPPSRVLARQVEDSTGPQAGRPGERVAGGRWHRDRPNMHRSRARDTSARYESSPRRWRHLPEDWDDEGEFLPGNDGPESGRSDGVSPSRTRGRYVYGDRHRTESGAGQEDLSGDSDDACASSDWPDADKRRNLRGDAGSDHDSSEVELLRVLGGRRTRHDDRRRRFRSMSISTSTSTSSLSRRESDWSGSQESERDSGGDILDLEKEARQYGNSQQERVKSSAGLFLMPEGEEAARALPSDIPDPTRGVTDPAQLRTELKAMLEDMEGQEASHLEGALLEACRPPPSVPAAGAETNPNLMRTLRIELREISGRITRTLRRLDVANNIFVRLEALQPRWREANEGVNAWHRLSGLSDRLEQMRRDANKAMRDLMRRIAEDDLSHSSGADLSPSSSVSKDSSDDFAMAPAVTAVKKRRERRARSRAPVSSRSERSESVRRVEDDHASQRSKSRGRKHDAESRTRRLAGGNSKGTGRSCDGPSGKKRQRRAPSSDADEMRRQARLTRDRAGVIGRYLGRETGGSRSFSVIRTPPVIADDNRDGPYLLGLDYGMAAAAEEDEHVERTRSDSLASSSAGRSSRCPSTPSSRSGSPMRLGDSIAGPDSPRRDFIVQKGDRRHRSHGQITNRAKANRPGSRTAAGATAGKGAVGGDSRPARARRTAAKLADAGDTRAHRHVRSVSARRKLRRTEINGRALMEQQYLHRLAQQDARGGRVLPSRSEQVHSSQRRDETAKAANWEAGSDQREERLHLRRSRSAPRLPSLVADMIPKPQMRPPLKFKTLCSATRGATSVKMDDLIIEASGTDLLWTGQSSCNNCSRAQPLMDTAAIEEPGSLHTMIDSTPRGTEDHRPVAEGAPEDHRVSAEISSCRRESEGSGDIIRALDMLPQRMADLEELATIQGLERETEELAKECCTAMAVIGKRLRAASSSVCASSCNTVRQPRDSLRPVTATLRRLMESCAAGHAGKSRDHASGLCLTRSVELSEVAVSAGTKALVGACSAFHVHLLEWLVMPEQEWGDSSAPDGEAAAATGASTSHPILAGVVVDFGKRLLLDLLYLFEKRLARVEAGHLVTDRMRGRTGQPPTLHVSRDPLAEVLSALISVLDGDRGGTLPPGPAAASLAPGLTKPLIGFWAVFFEVISRPLPAEGAVGLPSESVWKALIHALRVDALRRGWDDGVASNVENIRTATGAVDATGSARSGARSSPATTAPIRAARPAQELRRRETWRALWECVRLLLAASPFYEEFNSAETSSSVMTVVARATAAAVAGQGAERIARGLNTSKVDGLTPENAACASPPPLLAAAETFANPGMVARVLLERVLVLARFCPPEPGPQGVVERLWRGVQRISRAICVTRLAEPDSVEGKGDETVDSKQQLIAREERRLEMVTVSTTNTDLQQQLSDAADAWCLPVHNLCRLPRGVLEQRRADDLRVNIAPSEGDYEALCSTASLMTQEHALRLPEGLKRRKLANVFLKSKYSPPPGSSQARPGEDDVLLVASSRVLLGVSLGLARAGQVADAAREVVKAAALRLRSARTDTPRDRTVSLVAPAAAALCLTLPRAGGATEGVRATLFGALAACMRDAVDLMHLVLDGAARLGRAVKPERLERPRAIIGLVASCILVALRDVNTVVPTSPQPSMAGDNSNRNADTSGTGTRRSSARLVQRAGNLTSAAAAASVFAEALGRALQAPVADHLGRAAIATVISGLLQCTPPTFVDSINGTLRSVAATGGRSWVREEVVSSIVLQGFGMMWCDRATERVLSNTGGVGDPSAAPEVAASKRPIEASPEGDSNTDPIACLRGKEDAHVDEGTEVFRDEYGSWDGLVDDAELDALLGGSTHDPTSSGSSQQAERDHLRPSVDGTDQAARAVGATVTEKREEDIEKESWRSLAETFRLHVTPHLFEIIRKAYTAAIFAQGSALAGQGALTTTDHGSSIACSTSALSRHDADDSLNLQPGGFEVHADALLELHAAASMISLRDAVSGGSSGDATGTGSGTGSAYHHVRERYLDVHRMAYNPFMPQQRLLAPAFFSIALNLAHSGAESAETAIPTAARADDALLRLERPRSSRSDVPVSRPGPLLLECIRGREWELLSLWMQAAFDPLAFPIDGRRSSSRPHSGLALGNRIGSGSLVGHRPSDLVRERFEGFTRCLRVVFASDETVKRSSSVFNRGEGERSSPSLDSDVIGVFDKRLTRFQAEQIDTLSLQEAKVLTRLLDAQSVVAHCGGLWTAATAVFGRTSLPEADRKRIKDRVVKIAHWCIKCLRRFLTEVFPRDESTQSLRKRWGSAGSFSKCRDEEQPHPGYDSAFRKLYGHAAYSLAAFLMRMCGGALKGLPLRELVETFFEALACRALSGSAGRERTAGKGSSNGLTVATPHPKLSELAVMHLPDLLQCFSEMPMTVAPVAEWIKNINDHAINGAAANVATSTTVSTDTVSADASSDPVMASLASGLRGDWRYPHRPASRRAPSHESVNDFCELAAAVALTPSPRTDLDALASRLARMRLEVLSDRNLRVARFLMEAAAMGTRDDRNMHRVSIRKTRNLLVLLADVFRRRGGTESATRGSTLAQRRSPLSMTRDILPLVRPVYAVLGEALLGEPGPSRRLGQQAVGAAAALSLAALDFTCAPTVAACISRGSSDMHLHTRQAQSLYGTESWAERRVATCFAEAVVLMVSTKLDTFVGAMTVDSSGRGREKASPGQCLAALGSREAELERLLVECGAWQCHGSARGWPYHSLQVDEAIAPGMPQATSADDVESDVPLPALLREAEDLVGKLRAPTSPGVDHDAIVHVVESVLFVRIEACRTLLPGGQWMAVT